MTSDTDRNTDNVQNLSNIILILTVFCYRVPKVNMTKNKIQIFPTAVNERNPAA